MGRPPLRLGRPKGRPQAPFQPSHENRYPFTNWSTFAPPKWSKFTPPLTPKLLKTCRGLGCCETAPLCNLSGVRLPLPLALHCVESVLAVKGTLRRFAPWTAPGRSEGRPLFNEGKGGGPSWGEEVKSLIQAHDKGYYHSYISRSSCRGSDSNGAKSHVKGRSWDRLASQNLGRPRSCDSFSVQRQVKGPQDLGCGVEVNGTALVLTRPHLHTHK